MRKNTLNFVVDLLTLLAILAMVGTGLIMYYVLPAGSGGRGLVLWGLGRHDWGDIHFWASAALGGLLILHLALHWAWVCGTVRRLTRPGKKGGQPRGKLDNAWGVGFLVLVVGGFAGFVFIANAATTTSAEAAARHARMEHEAEGAGEAARANGGGGSGEHSRMVGQMEIRGSTTLQEIEAALGVPPAQVIEALGLPADTPTDQPLRVLRETYGLEMHVVRQVVDEATRR